MKSKKIIITISLVLVSLTVFVIAISAKSANLSATKETTESTTVDVNADFVYELKDKYDSYRSVKEEYDNLLLTFNFFEDKSNSSALVDNSKRCEEYELALMKYALKTFTVEEIDTVEKEDEMYFEICCLEDYVIFAEEEYDLAGISKKSECKERINSAKENLEAAEKVVVAYENGEITIDEALDKLQITYTGRFKPDGLVQLQREEQARKEIEARLKAEEESATQANGEFYTAAN